MKKVFAFLMMGCVGLGILFPVPSYAMASKTTEPAAESSPTSLEKASPAAPSSFTLKLNDHVLGQIDAPVTILEYASLTCPHCADFEIETLPSLKRDYISIGKVRLIYRDFPLDQWSLKAAQLTHCADKDFYFGLVEVLFKTQPKWTNSRDPLQALRQTGALAGVTPEKFEACIKDETLEKEIVASRLEAEDKLKISTTPYFLLYGPKGQEIIQGSQPYATFKAAIDKLLAGK